MAVSGAMSTWGLRREVPLRAPSEGGPDVRSAGDEKAQAASRPAPGWPGTGTEAPAPAPPGSGPPGAPPVGAPGSGGATPQTRFSPWDAAPGAPRRQAFRGAYVPPLLPPQAYLSRPASAGPVRRIAAPAETPGQPPVWSRAPGATTRGIPFQPARPTAPHTFRASPGVVPPVVRPGRSGAAPGFDPRRGTPLVPFR